MKKNLFLALALVVCSMSIGKLRADDFKKPDWKRDYKVTETSEVEDEEEDGVRRPSSGPGMNKKKEKDEKKSEVKPWKFEPKED